MLILPLGSFLERLLLILKGEHDFAYTQHADGFFTVALIYTYFDLQLKQDLSYPLYLSRFCFRRVAH